MAKLKRRTIGAVMLSQKDENGKPKGPNYIKIDKNLKAPVVLNPGDIVRVESKKFQLESLAEAEQAGRLSGDMLKDMRERAERIPDFVLGELVQLYEPK